MKQLNKYRKLNKKQRMKKQVLFVPTLKYYNSRFFFLVFAFHFDFSIFEKKKQASIIKI